MKTSTHSQSGFSLLELMIAIAIMGVVTAQLFVVMGNQKKVYASNERAVDTQETARMTLDLVSFDARVAGYMVPNWTAVSSVDGGATKPDRFCVSSVFADPGVFGSIPPNPMEQTIQRFDGATITQIGPSSVKVSSLDLNIPTDGTPGTDDFSIGDGIIIASKTETFCARIANIEKNPGDPTDNTITFETNDAMSSLSGVLSAELQAVPANVYELKDPLQLLRNGMLLASQIEDFQVEFWVDNNAGGTVNIDDGDTEFPVNNLKIPDPPAGGMAAANDRIRRVRVTVLAVAPLEDGANAGSGHLLYGRPAIANRDAATEEDRLRRRSFSASIMPRNTLIEQPES